MGLPCEQGKKAFIRKRLEDAQAAARRTIAPMVEVSGPDQNSFFTQHDMPPDVQQSASDAADTSTSQALCVDILVGGHINSFVDFFYLTHPAANSAKHDIPSNQLEHISAQLTEAEVALRSGDSETVFAAYSSLAAHFYVSRRAHAAAAWLLLLRTKHTHDFTTATTRIPHTPY